MSENPIICALDTTDIDAAFALTAGLKGHIGAVKLGLEFFTARGASGVARVAEAGLPIFLDLKFHDIPNTVAGAVRSAIPSMDILMTTLHASGGYEMMLRASESAGEAAAKKGCAKPLLLGVTVLTSMNESDLAGIGVSDKVSDQVRRLAALAQKAGLDGAVCSPHEIELIRAECGHDFTLVVPGIRPAGSAMGDQKRVLTPREAIDKGADYLVIGRPITESADPQQAAKDILDSLA